VDGRYLAFQEPGTLGGGGDIWTIDLVRNVDTKITFDPAIDAAPIWSPDARRLLFNSTRAGPGGGSSLFVKDVTSSTPEKRMLTTADSKFACDWSRDGRYVLYRSVDPTTGAYDLMAFVTDGGQPPFVVARTQYDERDGQFSPDGTCRRVSFRRIRPTRDLCSIVSGGRRQDQDFRPPAAHNHGGGLMAKSCSMSQPIES
jgi:Tol biopolymer transport system component